MHIDLKLNFPEVHCLILYFYPIHSSLNRVGCSLQPPNRCIVGGAKMPRAHRIRIF
jgi:hypothetical protein